MNYFELTFKYLQDLFIYLIYISSMNLFAAICHNKSDKVIITDFFDPVLQTIHRKRLSRIRWQGKSTFYMNPFLRIILHYRSNLYLFQDCWIWSIWSMNLFTTICHMQTGPSLPLRTFSQFLWYSSADHTTNTS